MKLVKLSTLLVMACLTIVLGYNILKVRLYEPEPYRQFFIRSDIAFYTAIILRDEDPDRFSKDLIYGSPSITILSKNSPLYLSILKQLYLLTDRDFDLALRWYSVLMLAVYLPGMYLFLYTIIRDWLVALALSLISSIPSGLYASGQIWGIPEDILLPSYVFIALAPWYGWLSYTWWLYPDKPTHHRKIFVLGMLFGLLLMLIHGLFAVAFIQLLTLLVLIQIFRKRVSWIALPVFFAGLILISLPRFIGGQVTGTVNNKISSESAREVIELSQGSMIYPWSGRVDERLGTVSNNLDTASQFHLALFAAYFFFTALTLFLAWRTGGRIARILFCAIQMFFVAYFINTGWLPLLIFVYLVLRIREQKIDRLDQGLLLAVVMSVWLGPLQQVIIYYFWDTLDIVFLTGLLYEIARFSIIGYLPFYSLLGLSIMHLKQTIRPFSIQLTFTIILTYIIYRNLNIPIYTVGQQLEDGALLIMALPGIYLISQKTSPRPSISAAAIGAPVLAGLATTLWLTGINLQGLNVICLVSIGTALIVLALGQIFDKNRRLIGVFGVMWVVIWGVLLLPRQPVETEKKVSLRLDKALAMSQSDLNSLELTFDPYEQDINPEFTALIEWVKKNTDEDSLFYTTNYYSSGFRVLANRPIIISQEEWVMNVYTQLDPVELRKIIDALNPVPFDPIQVFISNIAYGVEYMVTRKDQEIPLLIQYNQSLYAARQIYSNSLYNLYHIEKLTVDEAHFNLSPELYKVYREHASTLPVSPEAVIFNPATDVLADPQDEILNLGHFIALSNLDVNQQSSAFDLLHLLQQMQYEKEMSDTARAALQDWRVEKRPEYLRDAGIDYLLIDNRWVGFLSEQELKQFNSAYELIYEWTFRSIGRTYYLYRVP